MQEIVTPAAAETDAATYRLPLEAVLQVETVVWRKPPGRIGLLEPENPLLELAWLERVSAFARSARCCSRSASRVSCA